MLRYLTHKLRTQSLNETETYHVKTDDDRDSGTESDDEGAEIEELQKYMESIISLDSSRRSEHHRRSKRHHQQQHLPSQVTSEEDGAASATTTTDGAPIPSSRPQHHRHHHHHRRRTSHHRSSPALADSALPSDSDHNVDHHSSEEELEVINSGSPTTPRLPQPEKRKWDCAALAVAADGDEQTLGDDDENNCPVEFRTSPPAHAHKPSKCLRQAHIPAHELCSVSPRKRHRRTPTGQAIQRPCLDFEKMQQVINGCGRATNS